MLKNIFLIILSVFELDGLIEELLDCWSNVK